MSLLNLRDISVGFGGPLLLDHLNLRVESGERLCLVGRNGCGKSTLLKIMAGQINPEEGLVERQQGLIVAALEQEVGQQTSKTVFDLVAEGLGDTGRWLVQYEELSGNLNNDIDLNRLAELQQKLEQSGGWEIRSKVETVISKLQISADAMFNTLSGGQQRRVLLGRALVQEPDLLLLDEPTNHLDIDSIEWLEGFLPSLGGAIIFVTHDRSFLQALATRIVEIDRGQLSDWPGDYDNFLRRRDQQLVEEERENRKFDKKLAEEERWIRQGIKARRTRNEGRVRSLEKLREQRRARREKTANVNMQLDAGGKSGKLVIEAKNVSYSWGDSLIVDDFSATIMRGDRVALIGPNGCGKSTLLQLLLGKLEPDQGQINLGARLETIYFDQLRGTLDPLKSVLDNVAEGQTHIEIGGNRKHVIGYLQDFLFSPDRARTPVGALSGGERNRVLLAKMFTRGGNLLVMDEPTNDLDLETLELLEELLADFNGTLILVSHDRAFLNHLVTNSLVFEGRGKVNEYVGGYDDWLRQRKQNDDLAKPLPGKQKGQAATAKKEQAPKKLSYKVQHELENLPREIERLELSQEGLQRQMSARGFYQQDSQLIIEVQREFAEIAKQLASCYQRWEELESQ